MIKIYDNLYALLWEDYTQNNCNSYLIADQVKVLIDPGYQRLFNHVSSSLASLGLSEADIDFVLITHAHPDHIEGVQQLRNLAKFGLSKKEYQFFTELGIQRYSIPEPDFFLESGNLEVGNLKLEVIETPGHSPGSFSFYWPQKKVLFTGDVVFNQGIGRTDLPGGDGNKLKESIRYLKELDVEYILCGHGDIIAGKEAVQENFRSIEQYWFRLI